MAGKKILFEYNILPISGNACVQWVVSAAVNYKMVIMLLLIHCLSLLFLAYFLALQLPC